MKHIKQLQMLYLDPLNSKNSQLFIHVEFDKKKRVIKLYIQKLKELGHLKLNFFAFIFAFIWKSYSNMTWNEYCIIKAAVIIIPKIVTAT